MSAPRWIETGEGPRALVFLHGVSGGAAGAAGLLPAITPAGWRGLAWDMPGYGRRAPLPQVDFDALADALAALLDAAGLARAVLVGHSMGGMLALQVAARHPDRVAGLVLACCTPAFGAQGAALQRDFLARRIGPLDEGASMRDLAIEVIPGMVGPAAEPLVVHEAVDLMAEIPPASYRAAVQALLHFDQRAALGSLRTPTLVLAGRHDTVSRPLVLQRMAERIPGARFAELDAGHLAPFEAPEDFAREVHGFLEGFDHAPVTFLL